MLDRVRAISQQSHSFPMEDQERKRNQASNWINRMQGKLYLANQLILLVTGFKIIGMLKIPALIALALAQGGDQQQNKAP